MCNMGLIEATTSRREIEHHAYEMSDTTQDVSSMSSSVGRHLWTIDEPTMELWRSKRSHDDDDDDDDGGGDFLSCWSDICIQDSKCASKYHSEPEFHIERMVKKYEMDARVMASFCRSSPDAVRYLMRIYEACPPNYEFNSTSGRCGCIEGVICQEECLPNIYYTDTYVSGALVIGFLLLVYVIYKNGQSWYDAQKKAQ